MTCALKSLLSRDTIYKQCFISTISSHLSGFSYAYSYALEPDGSTIGQQHATLRVPTMCATSGGQTSWSYVRCAKAASEPGCGDCARRSNDWRPSARACGDLPLGLSSQSYTYMLETVAEALSAEPPRKRGSALYIV